MLAEMKRAEHEIVPPRRGVARAVVQNIEADQCHRDALLMLKLLVQGEADVTEGRTPPPRSRS